MLSVTHYYISNLVYEFPENGTKMLKHLGVMEDHTVQRVCNLCVNLVL